MAEKRTTSSHSRSYDIVIWGASSFVGAIIAEYFAKNVPLSKVKWAIGGRDKAKLDKVKRDICDLDPSLKDVQILTGNNSDQASIDRVVEQTRVLLSTVGPYMQYGTPVVDACVRLGTDYCDLTGEPQWVRTLIDKYHDQAQQKGVLIVNMSGFDSIPSDLGTLMVVDYIKNTLKKNTQQVKYLLGKIKGGVSGGTIASLTGLFEGSTKEVLDIIDPYYLCPPNTGLKKVSGQYDKILVGYDNDVRRWTGPFVMGTVNTRVVRRSAALLQDKGYSSTFRYSENQTFPSIFMALAFSIGFAIFATLMFFSLTRKLVMRVLPKPGEGPTRKQREAGFWQVTLVGTTEETDPKQKPAKVYATVAGHNDPGYNDTAKIVSEAALGLLLQRDQLPLGRGAGGVVPPAVALGLPLVERLKKVGFDFKIDRIE